MSEPPLLWGCYRRKAGDSKDPVIAICNHAGNPVRLWGLSKSIRAETISVAREQLDAEWSLLSDGILPYRNHTGARWLVGWTHDGRRRFAYYFRSRSTAEAFALAMSKADGGLGVRWESLRLPKPAVKALRTLGIETIGDCSRLYGRDVFRLKGCGRKTLRTIQELIMDHAPEVADAASGAVPWAFWYSKDFKKAADAWASGAEDRRRSPPKRFTLDQVRAAFDRAVAQSTPPSWDDLRAALELAR